VLAGGGGGAGVLVGGATICGTEVDVGGAGTAVFVGTRVGVLGTVVAVDEAVGEGWVVAVDVAATVAVGVVVLALCPHPANSRAVVNTTSNGPVNFTDQFPMPPVKRPRVTLSMFVTCLYLFRTPTTAFILYTL